MLTSLQVRNLGIVENLGVEFQPGLNIITGETGAGKSILLGGLSLVLGERADRSMIRSGENQCSVEAALALPDSSEVDAILEELDMNTCDAGRLILRRSVTATGGGKCLINDSQASVQSMLRIGNLLVDIHGPHDHQSLLSHDFQINLLDAYGHTWKLRSEYETNYSALQKLLAARKELDMDDTTVAGQIDLLSFQVREIEDAALKPAEDEQVEKDLAVCANATRIAELSTAVLDLLSESDHSAFNSTAQAGRLLRELATLVSDAAPLQSDAESVTVQIQELARAVSAEFSGLEHDPDRLQALENRMAVIHRLKRKYGGSLDSISSFHSAAKTKLDALLSRNEQIGKIEEEIRAATGSTARLGGRLGKERETAARSLAKAITAELNGLGFPHGSFEVKLGACDPSPSGCNTVEFGFAPNLGEPMRPLRVIASSGEISRVMLAVKTILAKHDMIPVLVFDEIDSNVGGEMGNAMGRRLRKIAEHHQVICITHFPQVAVFGTAHFVVSKETRGGRTRTCISPVEGEQRVEEIARMLGGRDLTTVTMRHARELLAGTQ